MFFRRSVFSKSPSCHKRPSLPHSSCASSRPRPPRRSLRLSLVKGLRFGLRFCTSWRETWYSFFVFFGRGGLCWNPKKQLKLRVPLKGPFVNPKTNSLNLNKQNQGHPGLLVAAFRPNTKHTRQLGSCHSLKGLEKALKSWICFRSQEHIKIIPKINTFQIAKHCQKWPKHHPNKPRISTN